MRTRLFLCATLACLSLLAGELAAKKGGKPGGGGGGGGEPPADPRILFTSEGAIHVMNDDGSNQTNVLDTGEEFVLHADWSPDGARIVFESRLDGEGIYVMDADGTNVAKIVAMSNFDRAHPVWSPVRAPDGRFKIAYVDKPVAGVDVRAVFCVNVDGSDAQQLTFPDAGSSGHWYVTWSPDATRIAVAADTEDDPVPEDVLVCDLDVDADGALEVVTTVNLMSEADNPGGAINAVDHVRETIAWAKTKNRLAVSGRLPGGVHEIYLIDVTTPVSPIHLTTGFNPSWSGDDGRIVFERWIRSNRRDVLVIDVDGAGETRLVTGSKRSSPHAPVWRR